MASLSGQFCASRIRAARGISDSRPIDIEEEVAYTLIQQAAAFHGKDQQRAGHPLQLRDRHIEQAQAYASQNNYRWVLLTNGVDWHLYHLTFDEGIEYERAFVVSLGTDEALAEAASKLALLHKQSVKKGELEEFWEKAAALGPGSICKALFSESVLLLLRREIRRDTGLLIDPEDLAKSLHAMLSLEAREQIGPLRVRRRRRGVRKRADEAVSTPTADPPPSAAVGDPPKTGS